MGDIYMIAHLTTSSEGYNSLYIPAKLNQPYGTSIVYSGVGTNFREGAYGEGEWGLEAEPQRGPEAQPLVRSRREKP